MSQQIHSPEPLTFPVGSRSFSALAAGSGPVVLLLHGFPDCLHSFDEQLPALAGAGYRAVAVAMPGYEPGSQRLDGVYDQAVLAGDVIALIDALDVGRVHLVGHDWGAAVGYAVAATAPQRLHSLTAMAVPHGGRFMAEIARYPRQLRLSWYMGFFQLPGLPEHVVRRRNFAFLRRLWRTWSPGWNFTDEDFAPVAETFARPGVVESALAYYRAAVNVRAMLTPGKQPPMFDVPVPTLAMTGEREGCIAADVFEAMSRDEDFSGGLEVQRVADAGHFLHRERPQAVNDRIIEWLNGH